MLPCIDVKHKIKAVTMKDNMWCLSFRVGFIAFNIVISSSIHFPENALAFFIAKHRSTVHIYNRFLHLSVGEHLAWFLLLARVSSCVDNKQGCQ